METESKYRQITLNDSIMAELSYFYCDTAVDQNEIFKGILCRISVLQNLLIGIIPKMTSPENSPPQTSPTKHPPLPANNHLIKSFEDHFDHWGDL